MAIFQNLLGKNYISGSRIVPSSKQFSAFEWFKSNVKSLFGAGDTRNTIRETQIDTTGRPKFPQLSKVQEGSWFKWPEKKKPAAQSGGGPFRPKVPTFVRPQEVSEGQLYLYYYNPKGREVLRYFDSLPLCLVLSRNENSWLGLNFHYLPPLQRARFFDLIVARTGGNLRKIHYELVKDQRATRHSIKRYLFEHVTSNVMLIGKEDWHKVLFLPIESFQKASRQEVWDDL